MDEELRSLQLDRLDKRGKSVEQIKRHSLEISLESKPIDKAMYLLAKGDEIQKLSVIENLPNLMYIDSQAAINKVIPQIQSELSHSSSEFNITTSRIFQVLIESHFKTDDNITSTVLQGLDASDPVVANAWLTTLLEVIAVLPLKVVQSEVLPVAVFKGQSAKSVPARVASCKILGKIALHPQMKPLEIKKDVLPIVYSLCQDVNYTVRGAICEQLPAISKGLGSGMVKNLLLSNLVELSSDDNANVKAIAVSSTIQILPFLDKETKTSALVPLVMNLCTLNTKLEDAASIILAKDMGMLMTALDSCLTVQQAEQLIQFYKYLSKRGLDARDLSIYNVDSSLDVKGREYCATNFPEVMYFTLNSCPANINYVYDIFKALAFDPCYIVRHTIAGIFHEVAQILGTKNLVMKPEFVRLLRDDAEEVLQNLVPNISTTLMLFNNSGTITLERTDAVSVEVGKALLKCLAQLLKGYNWRLITCFLKQLETLPMVFRGDHIHSDFTPQIVRCAMQGRTKPVRSQSVRTLLVFMRWNSKLVHRNWLRDHLIHELSENKCSYTRHVFVDMCKHASEIFSNKYFKENFFSPLMRLTNDKVSTIRYCIVSMFPKLRKMLHLPQDKRLFQSFEQIVINLEKTEKDRDVLAHLIAKTKEMMLQMQTLTPQAEANEKRLIEEEENVLKGKVVFSSVQHLSRSKSSDPSKTSQGRSVQRSQSVSREAREASGTKAGVTSSSSSNRSTSVPRSHPPTGTGAQKEIISDMTFLKQHFYIDAGVNLPIESNDVQKSDCSTVENESQSNLSDASDDSTVSESDSSVSDSVNSVSAENNDFAIDNMTVNMTDDVKVNMRRKKLVNKTKRFSHSEIPTAVGTSSNFKHKRHSSVYADSSVTSSSVVNKRRSLNIQPKELSKIPVISKSVENVNVSKNGENSDKESDEMKEAEKKEVKKISNLPVPIRRYNPQPK